MDTFRQEQLAKDVHLIATPFRLIGELLQIILFILIAPLVFVVNLIYSISTGTPLMSRDEIIITEIVGAVLFPFLVTLLYVFYRYARRRFEPKWGVNQFFVWLAAFVVILAAVKANFFFHLGWDETENAFVASIPIWLPLLGFAVAMAVRPRPDQPRSPKVSLFSSMPKTAVRLNLPRRVNFATLPTRFCSFCSHDVPAIGLKGLSDEDTQRVVKMHGEGCSWVPNLYGRETFF